MEVGARELAEAVQLLLAEFPDAPQSQLESVLRECGCDISAARRRLYELQESQQHAGGPMRAATPKVCPARPDGRVLGFGRWWPSKVLLAVYRTLYLTLHFDASPAVPLHRRWAAPLLRTKRMAGVGAASTRCVDCLSSHAAFEAPLRAGHPSFQPIVQPSMRSSIPTTPPTQLLRHHKPCIPLNKMPPPKEIGPHHPLFRACATWAWSSWARSCRCLAAKLPPPLAPCCRRNSTRLGRMRMCVCLCAIATAAPCLLPHEDLRIAGLQAEAAVRLSLL